MNGILLLLLGIVGAFAAGCSIALLALGRMIDQFPAGNESVRVRSISSPIETTRIAVVLFWALFIFGTYAVIQENRLWMITGITTFFAICLFMFTALVFSFAVLNALRNRKTLAEKLPVLQLTPESPAPVPIIEPAPVLRKRYNNIFTDFMLNALLKKD